MKRSVRAGGAAKCAARCPVQWLFPSVVAGQVSMTSARATTVSVICPSGARSKRPLQWPDLAEGRLRLERLATTAGFDFLPLPAAPSFLAKQQSRACAILRCAAVASDVSSLTSVRSIAIEAAMVLARN